MTAPIAAWVDAAPRWPVKLVAGGRVPAMNGVAELGQGNACFSAADITSGE